MCIRDSSGTNSKHIIAVIKPDANDNMKLRKLLELFFNLTPIIPPNVVPNVPKNRPSKVVFIIVSMCSPFRFLLLYLF